jgi:hypothetical protein
MLKREDLVSRKWEADGAGDRDGGRRYHQIDDSTRSGKAFDDYPYTICDTSNRDSGITDEEDEANSLLLAASPKLALACLEARDYIAHPLAQNNRTHAKALKTLRAALASAGVEVE